MSGSKTHNLVLPVPGHLTVAAPPGNNAPDTATLHDCLARGLDETDALTAWLAAHGPGADGLAPVPAAQQLTARQECHDGYFGVQRHGGGIDAMSYGVAQVMQTLAGEFAAGCRLAERDKARLLDGLSAVLQVASDR